MNLSLRQLFAAVTAAPASAPAMTMRTARNGEKVGLLGYGCMRLPTVDGGHANPWGDKASKTEIETFVKENTEDIAARIEKNVTEWLTK